MLRPLICMCLLLAAVVTSSPQNRQTIRKKREAAAEAEIEITIHKRLSADATAEETFDPVKELLRRRFIMGAEEKRNDDRQTIRKRRGAAAEPEIETMIHERLSADATARVADPGLFRGTGKEGNKDYLKACDPTYSLGCRIVL